MLEDLEIAKADLLRIQELWENYAGNNPGKYETQLRAARGRVRRLTQACKAAGAIERTPHEVLEARLDAAFPTAESRQIVEFESGYYRRRFRAVELSRSRKTVMEWEPWWEALSSDSPEVRKFRDPSWGAEQEALSHLLSLRWPFDRPAGGCTLVLTEGEPGLEGVEATKQAVGWTKGRPDLRVHLKATVTATAEAIETMRQRLPEHQRAARPELYLGTDQQGRKVFLRKAGRGCAQLALIPE